ncbi:MAG TPA: hypothetical protein P5526_25435 [Anaerolineae bacterium]|nr:hypothetical protein [Anaerolineae bacterium]HRV95522.1 hypothetical protein [Anaerolineae bacterium]
MNLGSTCPIAGLPIRTAWANQATVIGAWAELSDIFDIFVKFLKGVTQMVSSSLILLHLMGGLEVSFFDIN